MELATALSSARAALDLLQLGLNARDDAKVKAATADLNARISDITERAIGFQERNAALVEATSVQARRIAELEQAAMDRERYVLHELRPGAFAYTLRHVHQGPDHPAHHLCQPCYDKGVKAMLRYRNGPEWGNGTWLCPEQHGHAIEDTQSTRP